MPAALFAFDVENDTDAAIDYTIACTLGNYGCDSGVHVFSRDGDLSALHFTSADVDRPPAQRGDLAITTEGDGVEHVDYHVRGQWFDSLSRYWREFAKAGTADANGATSIRARPRRCGSSRSTARSRGAFASRPGETRARPLRDHLELSARRNLLVQPRPARRSGICRRAADLAQLLCDAMGRFARQRRRSLRSVGTSSKLRPALFAIPVRLLAPARDHRRRVRARSGCCAARPSSASKAASFGAGRASISARVPARAVAPMSGTTSRRSPGFFRRSNGRCARRNSPTTNCRTAG